MCLCSAEDPRVGGDSRRPAGVQLLPAGAQRRHRHQGQRKDDHLLVTGRERQPMTEHLGQEGDVGKEGEDGGEGNKGKRGGGRREGEG